MSALSKHPVLHYCRECASVTKRIVIFAAIQLSIELATFKPIHTFYEHMGWIK